MNTLAAILLASTLVYPKTVPKGVKVERDIEYARVGDKALLLDLYVPDKPTAKPMPVVVWIHSGAWAGGSKRGGCPALGLVGKGFAVAAVDYRLTRDKVTWPVFLHDCKAAVRWLRGSAKQYNLDPGHIGAWGSSAGGHLAAMLGLTCGDKNLEGDVGQHLDQSSCVQAVIDWCGATTRASHLAGRDGARPSGNPVDYAHAKAPPILIMHGDADATIPFSDSEALRDALQKAGAPVTFHAIPSAGHDFGNAGEETVRDIVRQCEGFMEKHLRP